MKRAIFFAVIVLLAACKSKHNPPQNPPGPIAPAAFINKDTANIMLTSYQRSIVREQDTPLNCLIVNADSLRAYLSDTSIKNMKLMFAHTQEYIQSGSSGVPAGYKSRALTLVIAGYNSSGDYVYYNGSGVMDHMQACPTMCPVNGTAAQNLFP